MSSNIAELYLRACHLRDSGYASAALPLFEAILASAPGRWDAWTDYANALADTDRHEEALVAFAKALSRRPDVPAVLQNRGITLTQMNRPQDALRDFARALEARPGSATLRFDAALAYLLCGDLERGLPLYEARFQDPRLGTPPRNFSQPLWTGSQPLQGRTILLHAEQGLGDTLQFVRYAPKVAALGARVVLEVQAPLTSLLAGVAGVASVQARGTTLPDFDYHCPLMSLPAAFATTLGSIPGETPYLCPDSTEVDQYRSRLASAPPRVGIAWSGSRRHRDDARRSIPLAALQPLADLGISLVSLQKAATPEDRAQFPDFGPLEDHSESLTDFAATAALTSVLDLVITVDTAVAHLAGALGRPVWILLPFAPDWRWMLNRDDSPWYPTARLFRQPQPGDWDDVVRRVVLALGSAAPASHQLEVMDR